MSVSPLSDLSPVTLDFVIGDGTPELDESGNFSAIKGTLQIKAHLVKASRQMADQHAPGDSISRVYLKGHMVEPMRMPPELVPGAKATTTINGRRGTFTLALSTLTGVETLVAQQMGDPIEGIFAVQVYRGNYAN